MDDADISLTEYAPMIAEIYDIVVSILGLNGNSLKFDRSMNIFASKLKWHFEVEYAS